MQVQDMLDFLFPGNHSSSHSMFRWEHLWYNQPGVWFQWARHRSPLLERSKFSVNYNSKLARSLLLEAWGPLGWVSSLQTLACSMLFSPEHQKQKMPRFNGLSTVMCFHSNVLLVFMVQCLISDFTAAHGFKFFLFFFFFKENHIYTYMFWSTIKYSNWI